MSCVVVHSAAFAVGGCSVRDFGIRHSGIFIFGKLQIRERRFHDGWPIGILGRLRKLGRGQLCLWWILCRDLIDVAMSAVPPA